MAERILIVEDNEINLTMLRDVLLAHGYEVIEARDGEEGIRKAREYKPNLILWICRCR